MPFLCCGARKDVLGDARKDVLGDARKDVLGDLEETTKVLDNPKDEASREKRERDLAQSIYLDARSSMTESMIYKPATFKISRRTLDLDIKPEDLLKANAPPVTRDSVAIVKAELQSQKIEHQQGYPGSLTDKELEACLKFRKEVKEKKETEPGYYAMVHILDSVEDEAFAICRCMRARKFVVNDTFKLMTGNLELWKAAMAHNYYPNLETDEALGAQCPMSVLNDQMPLVHSGIANNGSLVWYLKVENISLEALDCLTDLENFQAYMWHLLVHACAKYGKAAQEKHPDETILAELTIVIDLNYLKRSLFTERTIQVIKNLFMVLNCFPEILSKAVVMNAPFFFSAIWLIFKQVMDARTVAKIEIFSTEKAGTASLQKHVENSELLSDYGGSGPSYEDVVYNLRHPGTTRQLVIRFFFDKNTPACSFEFDLEDNEKMTIMVFTRSQSGGQFTISQGGGSIADMEVKRNVAGNTKPYARELAADLMGPGKTAVSAKPNSQGNDYFLVQVRVYPKQFAC